MRMFGAGYLLLDNEKDISHADGAGGDPAFLLLGNDIAEFEDSAASLCLCWGVRLILTCFLLCLVSFVA